MRKCDSLEKKDIILETPAGQRATGRLKTSRTDNITTWIELTINDILKKMENIQISGKRSALG